MNIKEDYVSFEIAKLLKEKGFDIKPFHQYYVSSCGKVFGCKGNEMKQTVTNRGYKRITLSIDGKPFESEANNPVDACYEMILKLNELNLL